MGVHNCSIVVLVLLPLLLASSSSAATDFDFFYHVQQWPGSFCDTKGGCCFPGNVKPAVDFGIHGLWPNYAACRPAVGKNKTECWPEFCNAADTFDPLLVSDLKNGMDRNWATLSCKSNDSTGFWSHEWEKHGTCSNMDQHAYFAAALEFKARFNLTQILLDAGVVPSDEETYGVSSILDAITAATGSKPSIGCNKGVSGEMQLYEVYHCVDRTGTRPVDCPGTVQGRKCTDTVQFPAF
ncbi:ribonuclease 1-like [Lolium rigidum]|uniref:ribonuclease 1-like n=1 Tax=Lolium rigidum TaxID=89674 RepID=UPI001F5D20B7|nr:ribonuclease 1-like [Lolium rigidum]